MLTVVSADTSRPLIPPAAFFFPNDTVDFVIPPSDTTARVYRRVLGVKFDDTTSGLGIRALFARYQATIISGAPNTGAYIVRVPDPGPTFAALDSLLARLNNEPGVALAWPLVFRETTKLHARFPSDGAGATRPDWFQRSASASTWAWLAIRAPLAWGCETGTYGAAPVRVGIIDYLFDDSHPDLDTSFVEVIPPPDSGLALDPVVVRSNPGGRSHGTIVAGLLTATGDNSLGVAGVMWRTELYGFALARDTLAVSDKLFYLTERVIPAAQSLGVRILLASLETGLADPHRVALLQARLKMYLDAGNLLVLATGNEGTEISVPDLLNMSGAGSLGLHQAAAALITTTNRQNILIVAGTDEQKRFWDDNARGGGKSNFIKGATEIAAPARHIRVLTKRGEGLPATVDTSGTSLSAPLVAGVAAQLWTMEPGLTPADVKHYILDGAREPRLSPTTGLPVRPDSVTGVPEIVYQLDAYGALTLLSREKASSPVCGFPVAVSGNTVRLEAPNRMPLTVAGVDALSALSVAQGGRRIAVRAFGGTAGFGQVRVLDHLGNQLGTPLSQDILERRYLERDTLDVILESRTTPCGMTPRTVLSRHGPSGLARLVPVDRLAPAGVEATDVTGVPVLLTAASRTGDRVAVAGTYGLGPDCIDTIQYRLDVLSFDAAPDTNVANFDIACGGSICPILDQPGAWSHDGRRLLLPIVDLVWVVDTATQSFQATGVRNTRLVQFVNRAGSDATFQGLGLVYPGFVADDSVATFAEFTQVNQSGFATNCTRTRRRAADMTLLTDTTADVAFCQFFAPGPGQIFNLRARLVAAVAQPADTARVGRGPPRILPRLGGARRVQAN